MARAVVPIQPRVRGCGRCFGSAATGEDAIVLLDIVGYYIRADREGSQANLLKDAFATV
jgi:hypothetical protein